jgi:phospholipid/cholesterol/gamma-HCH transport system substrate-binding protein
MSAYRKNILVGLTVVGSLVILGWMMLQFGGMAASIFVEKQIPVHLIAERADGVSNGSAVIYRGVMVGYVTGARLADNNHSVVIDALIKRELGLPGNVVGVIRQVGFVGGVASVTLEDSGPDTGKKLEAGQNIATRSVGVGLMPPEVTDLAKELQATIKQIRESNLIKHIDLVVTKTTEVVDSIQKLAGDEKVQGDLKTSIADLRATMQNVKNLTADADVTLKSAQGHVDEIAKQLNDRLLQVAKMLESVQSIAIKMDQGHGTAGKLLNDSRLYECLVDTSKELNVTIKTLKRLVDQWEQEGVTLRLH